ncbi:ATP phosphoribosyltransferase regulatory subunit [Azospirillum rugosum]|uniref:ATP phosphoribosyltransferase regulatory subunit n=1 Tax=Azospirillum rugosum TaxID=416170 RepID=A0ABS4SHN5_9PROT|nr:ATP phosphoribosyltransferase regulatory subunit [Azospirillum rugosum]MBP2291980.1 ATP phosphoribosyltransferase regulatory subunit [Azospirillum rugosum]MDQ0525884.1 ATP phosphoribosyltransferase regulatory subunit [Azospirillum rugosum]
MPADPLSSALLPAGLHDVLPPEAAHEAAAVERLLADFTAHGYQRVKPPLVEFEDNLLSGSGAAMAKQTFRLMDPLSQRMMAVRADITPQIARIATTRLKNESRPLRLCYSGQVLRVKGSQLRPERQFTQVGVELIGPLEAEADAEVILLAAHALEGVGVQHLSVDLCVPTMVPLVCRGLGLAEEEMARLRAALDRKDAAAVAAVGGPAAALLQTLMTASGPAERAMQVLASLPLPEEAEKDRRRLTDALRLLRAARPDLVITVDLVEHRGFEYQTGLSFTLFARDVRGELGAGGRYRAGGRAGEEEQGEPATGFTLYMDTLLRAVPAPAAKKRVYVPHGTSWAAAGKLRAEGWVTVVGLAPAADPAEEARRLGCGHRLADGAVTALE